MRLNVLLLLCFLFSYPVSFAQIPYNDSRDLIKAGIELYDKKEYKKAIEQYRQVHECDTIYATALYEEALSLQADSSYRQAKEVALSGLKLPMSNKREFLILLANSYDYLKQYDSAQYIYDSLMRQYPTDHQPWHEKGIAFLKRENYDAAVTCFQKALLINPAHARSHYMLGLTYLLQGRLSEAFIALESGLLMTKNSASAVETAKMLIEITDGTDEAVKYYKAKAERHHHPLFDEIDEIVVSKLALDKKYELKMGLEENIFRQTQAIMEKLTYDANDTNFVMQYYVPLLSKVFSENMFEPYVLLLFSGFDYKSVNSAAQRKKQEVDEVKNVVYPYYTTIRSTRELSYKKRQTAEKLYHYYPEDDYIIIGKLVESKDDKGNKLVGNTTWYRGSHSLLAKGYFDNAGKKNGWWQYYYPSGVLKTREYYANDNVRDTSYYYSTNGNLSRMTLTSVTGAVTAEYDYDYAGWLSTIKTVKPNSVVEERSFYANGAKEATISYKNQDAMDGHYPVYHPNGRLKKELTLKDGKYNGAFKAYDKDGRLSEEAVYEDGEMNGRYTAYHPSGKVKETYNNTRDKADGAYIEYYENGDTLEYGVYSKGVKMEVNRYSRQGRLYCSMKFNSKGVPERIRCLDDKGKVVFEQENKQGVYEYSLYHPNGVRSVDMKLNDKGEIDGVIRYYFRCGDKSDEITYVGGKLEGKWTTYFRNGKVSIDATYANNEKDGYYKSYYANGKPQQEGWYKAGKKQGLWKAYFKGGQLHYEMYYLNDQIDGYLKEYTVNGVLNNKYVQDRNNLIAQVCYDTAGVRTDSVVFTGLSGTYEFTNWPATARMKNMRYSVKFGQIDGHCSSKYLNGAMREEINYSNGEKDSLYTSYYPNGKVCARGMYRDGDMTGRWEHYNEAGDLLKEDSFLNGVVNGHMKAYAAKRVRIEYNFKEGNKDGAQTYYGEGSRIAFVLYYDDGDLVGYTHEGKDGRLLPEIKLNNSATVTTYYSNGQKSGEFEVEKAWLQRKLKVYFANGQLAEERNYDGEFLEGPLRRYNADGRLVYEVSHLDDEEDGIENTYSDDGKLLIAAGYYQGIYDGKSVITDPATGGKKTYYYKFGELVRSEE